MNLMRVFLAAVLCMAFWLQSHDPVSSAELGKASISLDGATRSKCLKVLRQGAQSDEFWPSIHAAEALALAGQGVEVRRMLEPKLKAEQDDQRRCGLARELVRAGDRAKAAIMLDILAGRDPHGHVHACESLYKVNEIGDGQLLRDALKQKDDPIKALIAAAALGRWGSPAAMALLRRRVTDDDGKIARIAAWVLARIGDSRDITALRTAARRFDDLLTRAYFDHALAALGDPAGLAALARNLNSDDPAIRTYAATFAGDARATSVKEPLTRLLDDENIDVRVRAAQSLLVLSLPAPPDPAEGIVRDVYVATKENPRYSEGSVLPVSRPGETRRDGMLLYATTGFIGSGSDFAKAQIIARQSPDGGRTWGPPRVLQENIGKRNVMSVTLRRLTRPRREATPIGMFYLVKNGFDDLDVYLRISRDEARTFGDPILVTSQPGYHVMNNDRVTLLSTGRLLVPVASTEDVRKVNHFVSRCYISDDAGKTWRSGKGTVDLSKRGAMEPEVFERPDGTLGMILRTQLGYIGISDSRDGGDTWGKPRSWNVPAPEAPATLRRIPSTGDLLLIWNDNYVAGAGHSGRRTPLTVAVSSDEGKTWKHKRNLETSAEHTYAYTSLTFVQGRALLSYYVRDEKTGRISSRFRSLPIAWFYEQKPG